MIMASELKLFATVWGLVEDAGGPFPLDKLPALCAKLQSLGYAGIEIPIAFIMKFGSAKFAALLASRNMLCITQVFSSGGPPTPGNLGIASEYGIVHPKDSADTRCVATHKAVWGAQIQESARLGAVVHSVNSHTGKDYFTPAEADDMLAHCLALEKETGLTINRACAALLLLLLLLLLPQHPPPHTPAPHPLPLSTRCAQMRRTGPAFSTRPGMCRAWLRRTPGCATRQTSPTFPWSLRLARGTQR